MSSVGYLKLQLSPAAKPRGNLPQTSLMLPNSSRLSTKSTHKHHTALQPLSSFDLQLFFYPFLNITMINASLFSDLTNLKWEFGVLAASDIHLSLPPSAWGQSELREGNAIGQLCFFLFSFFFFSLIAAWTFNRISLLYGGHTLVPAPLLFQTLACNLAPVFFWLRIFACDSYLNLCCTTFTVPLCIYWPLVPNMYKWSMCRSVNVYQLPYTGS